MSEFPNFYEQRDQQQFMSNLKKSDYKLPAIKGPFKSSQTTSQNCNSS